MAGVGSATIASTLGIGSASAETEYQKEPHEEEREILKKGGVKQLEKYARKKDVEYELTSEKMEVPQEDGAGTDNYYNSGEISVFTWGSPENQSEFLLAVQMDLEDFSFRPSHLSNTPDIIALSHDHPDFIPVGDPEIWATPDESGEFHETSWFSGSTDGDGLVGRVEFETGVSHMPYPDDLRIGMATSLVWEGNTIPRVWGSYQHTASILSNSVDSVSLGVGGISIDFSGNVEIHDVADWANP